MNIIRVLALFATTLVGTFAADLTSCFDVKTLYHASSCCPQGGAPTTQLSTTWNAASGGAVLANCGDVSDLYCQTACQNTQTGLAKALAITYTSGGDGLGQTVGDSPPPPAKETCNICENARRRRKLKELKELKKM